MGKKRVIGKQEPDEVSKYKSPNTGEYVMASQYIAEIIVSRKANKDGVKLEYKYWNNKDHKYHKQFKYQVSQAAILLKKYRCKAIVITLNEMYWCFSLKNPKFLKQLESRNAILLKSEEEARKRVIEVTDATAVSKPIVSNKTMLSRLRKINGKEEKE
jgi:hypothetical protein